jgi:hypothetical protein
MKVLFVAPYRQNDGWGASSRNWIKAISHNKNIQLAIRPIYYIPNTINIDQTILEYENSYYTSYDTVIQKVLPANLHINSSVKNIGILTVETCDWSNSRNILLLNKLDEIYVSTPTEKKHLEQSGIKTKISIVPEAIDTNIVTNNKESDQLPIPSNIKRNFIFYCMAGPDPISNLDKIITAFHLAFDEQDSVSLLIKTDDQNNMKHIQELSKKIKETLRINKVYRNEIIVGRPDNETSIMSIHNTGNCFINLKSTDNFCKQTLIASYLGKTPIVMQNTGLADVLGKNGGIITKSVKSPLIMQNPPLMEEYDSYNSREFVYSPIILNLIENMQKIYTLYKADKKNYNNQMRIDNLTDYSFESIGAKICN